MRKCTACGITLPPLNGCEENDFRYECEECEINSHELEEALDQAFRELTKEEA